MIIYPEEFTDLSICIRTAARIIADDIGAWKGEIFSDIDVSPFRRDGGKKLGLVMFTAHEYAHLEPIGKMKIACEAIEAAMVRAVELNQIKPLQVSRHLSGEIKPEQTFLGLTDIFKWCEVVDLEVGETLFEYLETEQNLRTNMIGSTNRERFKLENRAALDQARESTDKLSEEEINGIVIENRRLREGDFGVKHEGLGRILQQRERNTLLTIIAVLAKEAKISINDYSKPGKAAGYIEGLTSHFGARVSKRAIEEHLKKIPDALAPRMK